MKRNERWEEAGKWLILLVELAGIGGVVWLILWIVNNVQFIK